MRALLLLCFLFFGFFALSSFAELIKHKAYTVETDDTGAPIYVAYKLTKSDLAPNTKRADFNFTQDPLSKISRDMSVFTGKHRSHLCPAEDREADKEKLRETFYDTNITPEIAVLNCGAVKVSENQARKRVLAGENLVIVTGPLYSRKDPRIPSGRFKSIRGANGEWEAYIFQQKNTAPLKIPPDWLAALAGLNFEQIAADL